MTDVSHSAGACVGDAQRRAGVPARVAVLAVPGRQSPEQLGDVVGVWRARRARLQLDLPRLPDFPGDVAEPVVLRFGGKSDPADLA